MTGTTHKGQCPHWSPYLLAMNSVKKHRNILEGLKSHILN